MAQLSTLQQRELEYRRMNEEMEQKTAVLMQEAEQMLRKHEALLADRKEPDDARLIPERVLPPSASSKPLVYESTLMGAVDIDLGEDDGQMAAEGLTSIRSKAQRRVLQSASERKNILDDNAKEPPVQPGQITGSTARRSAPPARAITQLDVEDTAEFDNGIVPETANQMSAEAQLRFFKAKVRVLQEELDRTQHELALRSREAETLTGKVQEADEDRNRLTRQVASLQQTLTKQKKLADDNEARATALERTMEAVRREADSARRESKKTASDKSAHEVRLNRAMEETEHLRQELAKARASARDVTSEESRKVEKLTADVRRLERQRKELIEAFKKSLKLIDVLKRQKLHLEAARLLQFREEEFVRALDWDKQAPLNMPINNGSFSMSAKRTTAPSKRAPSFGASSAKTTSSATSQQREQQLNLVAEGHAEPLFDEDISEGSDDAN